MQATLPSSAGWQLSYLACSHSMPGPSDASDRNAGLVWPKGKNPAPTSCRNPGRVSASVPTAPPARRGFASSTSTRKPRRASAVAANRPFGPEPITTTSGSVKRPPCRRTISSTAESLERAGLGLRRLHGPVSGGRRRDQGMDQPMGHLEHVFDRLVEGRLVGLRRLVETAQLADELQRRRADLVIRGRRLEVEQDLDAATHGPSI